MAVNKTLNQIINLFNEIGEKHKQINHFYFGSFLSAMKEQNVTYPLLVVDTISAGLDRNNLNLSLVVSVCDKVYKDHDNMNEVQSDTLSILSDIVDTMDSDKWKSFSNLSGTASAQRFVDDKIDEVTGWAMNLTLTITSKKDLCAIPFDNYDFDGNYTRGCNPVKIFEDGVLVETVESGGSYSYSSGGGTVNVSNSDDTYSVDTNVDLELPDITHTDSDGSPVILPAQTPFVATTCSSSDIAKPIQTGQTISYQSNDDGDLENGRLVDFFTLNSNNSFGNTNRFTDTLGTQIYANDIVIDHATNFKWYRIDLATELGTGQNFSDCIINAATVTVDSGGWRAPNINELLSIANFEEDTRFSYAPMNFTITGSGARLWTSTTNSATGAGLYFTEAGRFQAQSKTNQQTTLILKNI